MDLELLAKILKTAPGIIKHWDSIKTLYTASCDNPERLSQSVNLLLNNLRQELGNTKVDIAFETRDSVFFLILKVANPNSGVMALVNKLKIIIADGEMQYGGIFDQFKIILETSDKKTYYLRG